MLSFQAVDTFGGIDILVSNAAVNPAVGPVLDVSTSYHLIMLKKKQFCLHKTSASINPLMYQSTKPGPVANLLSANECLLQYFYFCVYKLILILSKTSSQQVTHLEGWFSVMRPNRQHQALQACIYIQTWSLTLKTGNDNNYDHWKPLQEV